MLNAFIAVLCAGIIFISCVSFSGARNTINRDQAARFTMTAFFLMLLAIAVILLNILLRM